MNSMFCDVKNKIKEKNNTQTQHTMVEKQFYCISWENGKKKLLHPIRMNGAMISTELVSTMKLKSSKTKEQLHFIYLSVIYFG